jgi:hypothetical protein
MPLPELSHLDRVRKLRGDALVTHPGGSLAVVKVERVFSVPRGTPEPAYLTADSQYPTAKLVEQHIVGGDHQTIEVYRMFHTLPGVAVTQEIEDPETHCPVLITSQLIATPALPIAQPAGSIIEFSPINAVYGTRIITTINGGTPPASRTELKMLEYNFPALLFNIVGTPIAGRDVVVTNSVRRAAFTRLTQSRVTYGYGTLAAMTAAYTTLSSGFPGFFNPALGDAIYDGVAFNVNERNFLSDGFTVAYSSATLAESFTVNPTTPTASEYLAQVGQWMYIGFQMRPWRAGWWRLEAIELILL